MTRSTLTGGWVGALVLGCDGAATPGPVLLEMGTDDPTSGNSVTWMQGQNGMGDGVVVGSCARASIQYNTISDCSNGLNVGGGGPGPSPTGPPHRFVIKHNTFARMSRMGLVAYGSSALIDEISDNRFLGTTRLQNTFERAVGLRITEPIVGKVRRNVFAGNDVGLRLDPAAEMTDIGRPDDPGENVFYCNSGVDNWLGGDVLVSYPPIPQPSHGAGRLRSSMFARQDDAGTDGGDAGAPALLHFAGNVWDHVAPRVEQIDFPPNGVEIFTEWAPPLGFDLSGASLVTTACPPGRVP
jgi:Protein of unknown function (DUF1565)